MCTLFAATHPDRTQALITLGAYARRNWAPDYPIGRRAEQDGWLRPTAEQWGRYATERFLEERAPTIATDEAAIDWYTSYLVRGASPAAVAAITDMNEEIDVRHVLASVRVPTLVALPRARVPARGEPLHGRAAAGRAGGRDAGRRPPAVGGRPGARCWPRSSSSSPGCATEPTEPNLILTTVLDAEVPEAEQGMVRSAVARFRGQLLDAPHGRVRASFDGPARAVRCASALAESMPQLRAGVHTGECELRDGRLAGPALEIAAGVARAAAAGRDPRHLDRAGPRRRQRASSSPSAAPSSCRSRAPRASGACSPSSADTHYRAFTGAYTERPTAPRDASPPWRR